MFIIYEAKDLAMMPRMAIPPIMSSTAITRPVAVTGYRSLYPTVVIAVDTHHNALPKDLMFDPVVWRSASRINKNFISRIMVTLPVTYMAILPRKACRRCDAQCVEHSQQAQSVSSAGRRPRD
jgi:hypothetical protein